MHRIKTILLTLYFFIGILIPSCEWVTEPDCNCGSYRFFNVTDLTVDPVTDFDSQTRIAPSQQVTLAEFAGLYVDYVTDYHACLQQKSSWSFNLMSPAYGCSCALGWEGSKDEELVNFTVSTINDFDDEHLAGSSINDLLQYEGSYFDESTLPLVDFLADEQMDKLRYEDMRLSLSQAPVLDSVFQVKVHMELSTGEVYDVTSAAIVLLP